MVQALRGTLIQCTDVAVKQFILYLQDKGNYGQFVLEDLDETTLLIQTKVAAQIKKELEEFTESNAYDKDTQLS